MEDKLIKINEQLVKVGLEVDGQLRMKAGLEMCCDYSTIKKYLQGQGKKIGFAEKLLNFLTKELQAA